jgi:xylan 1,4-beta-xylosidase
MDGDPQTQAGRDKSMIRNPILKGFNPDPSILRVGDDYYIATSTFEWYPGVQIHHSRDLVNWRLLTRPLRRPSQLNMLGDADSCGVWAPCLSHDGKQFYLIYTDVKRYGRTSVGGAAGASLRDFHNYMVTCDTIDGDWSDPVYMNSSGFDPSLFHDDDGRKWFVNMLWDHRPGQNRFAGIVAQEYSPREHKLNGERVNIFKGTPLGLTEAPHLYKRGGYYYLITAEGGTAWNHAVTLCRSKNLMGPYELHPDAYILSARNRPDASLQRTGHADLVETQSGDTYMAYLCGRPLKNRGRCTLGRETAIQKMQWSTDGWLYTLDRSGTPTFRHIPFLPRRTGTTSIPPSSPLTGSGCARLTRTPFSASPHGRATCACSDARASAACSPRHWWRAVSRPIATARKQPWTSSRHISSRRRDWSAITVRTSSTIFMSAMTKRPASISV